VAPQIKLCHFPQPEQINFGVDTSRRYTLVPKVIPDFLEVTSLGEKPAGASMAQAVGTFVLDLYV
jgi:hypothetical protein